MTKTKSMAEWVAARRDAAAGRWAATAVTDPWARGTAAAGAGSRNGSDRNKNKTWLGTMGKTREKGGHEAARSVWDLARDNSRADEAAEDRVRCSENDMRTRRDGAV